MSDAAAPSGPTITEVLPKAGLVYSEKSTLTETLCKPKIMAIKSSALERLEQMELDAQKVLSGQTAAAAAAAAAAAQPPAAAGGRPQSSRAGGRPGSARPTSASGPRQQ